MISLTALQWRVEAEWFRVAAALSICVNMILAATIGAVIQMLLKRIRIGSAFATGLFVLTLIDIIRTYLHHSACLSLLSWKPAVDRWQ
ncbi:MAG: hypothetical protein OXP71_11355 [Candidatus Poribacteria bacterium]|nr:hypothetical protein [Candidatus Poribacteria bacterium]